MRKCKLFQSLLAGALLAFIGACAPSSDSKAQISDGLVKSDDSGVSTDPMGYTVHLRGSGLCSGSIIHPRVILTAAHCESQKGDRVYSFAGSSLSSASVIEVRTPAEYSLLPKGVSDSDFAAVDVTLLLLDKELQGRPIPLADRPPPRGTSARISGFGSNNLDEIDGSLRAAFVDILDVANSTVNAGSASIRVQRATGAMCSGDSGGPLVYLGRVVGVLSNGDPVCKTGQNDYFASVYHQSNWIRLTMDSLLSSTN